MNRRRVTIVKEHFLVLVLVYDFGLFEFLAAILATGLLKQTQKFDFCRGTKTG